MTGLDSNIKNGKAEKEIYYQIESAVNEIISIDDHVLTVLSNLIALLKQTFDKISWIGFYLFDGKDLLILGPFQGKVACTQIKIGNGVCGKSALKKDSIIVQDVDQFPGHIYCDGESKSEIVIPLIAENNLLGVLDLDSYKYSAFNEIDKLFLEKFVSLLCGRFSEKISKLI